jgi:hypothetical protein
LTPKYSVAGAWGPERVDALTRALAALEDGD